MIIVNHYILTFADANQGCWAFNQAEFAPESKISPVSMEAC